MVGIVLTGHGHIASGIASSVEMIAGPQEHFKVLDFSEDIAGEYPARLRALVDEVIADCGSCLVVCDLLGGTPFNQAMLYKGECPGLEVVTGASLPVLLEVLMGRDTDAASLAEAAVEAGKVAVLHPVLDEQTADESDLDGGI